jgi:putative ABC transport system permease protein
MAAIMDRHRQAVRPRTTVVGLLVGVSPWDPVTLGAVAGGLLLVSLAACYVPARRVLRIDPASLLGQE